jgi:hypothetical protein
METKLNWKKRTLKETYEIYSNGILVGTLKENIWKQIAYGTLNGKKVIFKTKGFLKPRTLIIDPDTQANLGKITYNLLLTKATIESARRVASWKYDNIWGTKWSISNPEGVHIRFRGSSSRGTIEHLMQDDLLVLTGLYVTNYYWQVVAAIVAVGTPLLTMLIN